MLLAHIGEEFSTYAHIFPVNMEKSSHCFSGLLFILGRADS